MFKKLAAVLLLVGLCLPYSCDVRPITGAWENSATTIGIGIPVIVAVAYGLQTLVARAARYFAAHGAMLHGLLRMAYFVLAGFYLGGATRDKTETKDQIATGLTLAATGALLYWLQQRGTKAERLPLLLLTTFGVAGLSNFLSTWVGGGLNDLQIGGWLVTAGFLIATVAEAMTLAKAARITHGG